MAKSKGGKVGVARKTAAPGPVLIPPQQPPKDKDQDKNDTTNASGRHANAQSTTSSKDRRKPTLSRQDSEFASGTVGPAAPTKPSRPIGSASNSVSLPKDDRSLLSTKTSSSNALHDISSSPNGSRSSLKLPHPAKTSNPQVPSLPTNVLPLGPSDSAAKQMGNQQSHPSDNPPSKSHEGGTMSRKSKHDGDKRSKSGSSKSNKKGRKDREEARRLISSATSFVIPDDSDDLEGQPPRKKSKHSSKSPRRRPAFRSLTVTSEEKENKDKPERNREVPDKPTPSPKKNDTSQREKPLAPNLSTSSSTNNPTANPSTSEEPTTLQQAQPQQSLEATQEPTPLTSANDSDASLGIHNMPSNSRLIADYARRNSGTGPLPPGLPASPLPQLVRPPTSRTSTNDSLGNEDRAEQAISRIRSSRQNPIVLDEDDEPAENTAKAQNTSQMEDSEPRLASPATHLRGSLGTGPEEARPAMGGTAATGPRINSNSADPMKNKIAGISDATVVLVNGLQNNPPLPHHPQQTNGTLTSDSANTHNPSTRQVEKSKGKDTSKSPTKTTLKGKRNRIDPPQMQRLLAKKKLEGPDAGFSWSVESTPAPRSPPQEAVEPTSLPQLPAETLQAELERVQIERSQGALRVGGPRPPSLISSEPGEGDVSTGNGGIANISVSPPKTIPQGATYINLDSDEEDAVLDPRTPTSQSFRPQQAPSRPKPSQASLPAADHHMDVDTGEAGYGSELDPVEDSSRPPMADYRSFRPPLTKSKMVETYGDMGRMDPFPHREIEIDWKANSAIIDRMLNNIDDRMARDEAYRKRWDSAELPKLEQKSEAAERTYFGTDYLEKLLSCNLSEDNRKREVERLELTCFSLFQEAAAYIVQANYKASGFPYKNAVRGILDTYFLHGKQSMTPLQRLLFLFDKINFVGNASGEGTTGSDRIGFADWYRTRTPVFSGYKGVLSESAILDLVDIHTELMRLWERGEYEIAPESPSVVPRPQQSPPRARLNSLPRPTPNAESPQPQQQAPSTTSPSTGHPPAPPPTPVSPLKPSELKQKQKQLQEEAEKSRAAAATASTVKKAIDDSLPPPVRVNARAALKRPHNLMHDLAREAKYLNEERAKHRQAPRFLPENMTRKQRKELMRLYDRLSQLENKENGIRTEMTAFTKAQDAKIKEAIACGHQLLELTDRNHAALNLLVASSTEPEEVLKFRDETSSVEDATWSELPKFLQRRTNLVVEGGEREMEYIKQINTVKRDIKLVENQVRALRKVDGSTVTLPDQFLEFTQDFERSMKKVGTNLKNWPDRADKESDDEEHGQEDESSRKGKKKERRVGPEVLKKVTRAELKKTGGKIEMPGVEEISSDSESDGERHANERNGKRRLSVSEERKTHKRRRAVSDDDDDE
ncbi:hypothetical protein BJ508DRAFT_303034 [Ascobolus immersus RN42]|uniref:Uncharacterized protein n=1 Tax=Ascobolus immersus RN42 TaxID=1160509 RepID=A0A3N4IME6_ASCIM|nr:hypothetical protein BJ508DRAFT_303034 [Ascobolus immersus RN42]